MDTGPFFDLPETPRARQVSIVIPTYNNLSLLLECLGSLRLLDYPAELIEIVVVDNASTDRTQAVLKDRFPYVKLVTLDTNTGFAVACNKGAAVASGEYIAFLNNDAVVDPGWLKALFAALDAAGGKAVCAASRILSHNGEETEYDGAASNLFAAGRPTSVWGWPDNPEAPSTGSPVLFASGGAMLIHRATFLDVGGFDPAYFAYFEDVDLGWRLWALGYDVVYAPDATVRHIGGATGKRSGSHRRYTLWESNSLATVLKNYESGNMERILSAALLLQYKRALLSAGDAIKPADYRLSSPPDNNVSNVERMPKVSVAHIVAIDRFNSMLPHLMEERRTIQAKRVRSDAEILPLLGRAFEPQYAGTQYADGARALASTLELYGISDILSPNRVLIVGTADEASYLKDLASRLKDNNRVAIVQISPKPSESASQQFDGYTQHTLDAANPIVVRLIGFADALIVTPTAAQLDAVRSASAPIAVVGASSSSIERAIAINDPSDARVRDFWRISA
ncbi:MAG: glycosyltransferase family 2 protein [Chloroflexota bacterium]